MSTPPAFFYNPNAYALGIIKAQAITCHCCGQPRDYCYADNLYSRATAGPLCPWCIADGRAARQYGGSFVSDLEGFDNPVGSQSTPTMSEQSMEQVSSYTPGYPSWQGSVWLGHCGDACIFVGFVGSTELAPIWEQVQPDVVASGWGEENVRATLRADGDLTGYLFQCQHCGQHRLHIDAS